jgi:hypothetical protein
MAFGITPAGSGIPATDTGWPRFIQFQNNGVNLGGPDADTVNFIGDIVATRGASGEDENTVTVILVLPVS